MSGVLIIIVDLLFGVWGAFGKAWYWYILNFILLFTASSIFNTTYIQCITRCYSVIVLKGKKGIGQNIGLIILTFVYWSIGYLICRITFQNHIQIALFVLTCLVISTIVAIIDNQFKVAIERTKRFAEIGDKIKEKKMATSNNYKKLKELISQDNILLLPHKKYKGIRQTLVYARCGMSQKYFEKAYNNGDVILQLGEVGPRVGHPVPWEQALNDFINNNV